VNKEQLTLREVIQQRFEELDAHIAALDAVTIKSQVPSFLTTYSDLHLRYEIEGLLEKLDEFDARCTELEKYQTVQRFVIRQIVSVLITAVIVALCFYVAINF
jgi:hypothetical protein